MFALTHKVPLGSYRIVLDTTRCSGGVSYQSETLSTDRQGDAVETKSHVTKHVDHEKAVARIDQARRKVVNVVRKHCKISPLGWLCAESQIGALEQDMQGALADCADANMYAELQGSARRVKPGLAYAHADWSDQGVISLVYEALAESVKAQADLARTLDPLRLPEIKVELLKIARMVGGPARAALETAARDIQAIAKARRDGADPDYSVLDAAVEWFAL